MKSILNIFAMMVIITASAFAITPKYQGFDVSYVELGDYKMGSQMVTILVDDAPFHFKLEAGLNAGGATQDIAISIDDLEFAVGYIDKPTQIKGEDHYFEYVDLIVLWEGEPLDIRKAEFTLIPPYSSNKKAQKASKANAAAIAKFNKQSAPQKYAKYESLIDNATATAWNKQNRLALKNAPSPAVAVTPSANDELKAKLAAAKLAQNSSPVVVASPQAAAIQANQNTQSARSAMPKSHLIEDENTRKLLGYTLLATGVVTGFQAIFEHQTMSAHHANYKRYEEVLAGESEKYGGDSHFIIQMGAEGNSKAKHESNRNLAAIISIFALAGGTVIINF